MSLLDDRAQTRVLLPDTGPTDHRRPRPRRARYLVAAAILLGLLGVSVALPRLHARPSNRQSATAPPAELTSVAAPVEPSRRAGQVPVGYPHTAAGAQSAATNYVVTYGGAGMFVPATRHTIVAAITDPAVRQSVQAQLDSSFTALTATFGLDPQGRPPAGQQFVCRALPVGVRLLAYRGDTAQVSVWSDGIVGLAGAASTKPVAEAWTTTDVTLHWVGGDWKWVTATQHDGPTPVSGTQPASDAGAIARAVATYEGLRYAR